MLRSLRNQPAASGGRPTRLVEENLALAIPFPPKNATAFVRIWFIELGQVHEGRRGTVPRPTLLAALVGKVAATQLPKPERHYRDLALLFSLVPDPFALVDELTLKDRQRLRAAADLLDEKDPAWVLVPADLRSSGQIAARVLMGVT